MSDERSTDPKASRHVDYEYLLAAKAARNFVPMTVPDIWNWQKAAFEHGYVQALLDVQDGKVDPSNSWVRAERYP